MLLNTSAPRVRPAAILGNGPSMRNFDFKNDLFQFDTFGMNAAYRYWDTINWYPQYYSCLDVVVGISHLQEIRRLIVRAEQYGIKQFLLRDNIISALGDCAHAPYVNNFEKLRQSCKFFASPRITTGSHTAAWAAALGYRNIILCGIDANYIEQLPESTTVGDNILEIQETPKKNPNYFFDTYQRKGDRYHMPNPSRETGDLVHLSSWDTLRPIFEWSDTIVVNANPSSCVSTFPRCSFSEALPTALRIQTERKNMRDACCMLPEFTRKEGVVFDELRIFYPFFPEKNGIMIDVGAHFGGSCLRFLRRGWRVYAFEPDPVIRQKLQQATINEKNIIIDSRAVSKVSGRIYPWYTTAESTGAGSMRPFTDAHGQCGTVTTITLKDYIAERNISHLDFLKIDAEGFDYMVLQGFPFKKLRPAHILCEFEDRKTVQLGSTMSDMGDFLLQEGYTVFISEWHPIIRYGIPHQWRRFLPYPTMLDSSSAWGNLLAFASPPDIGTLLHAVASTAKVGISIPKGSKHAIPDHCSCAD